MISRCLLILVTFSWTMPAFAASSSFSWLFRKPLSFSPHVFDGLVTDGQMQLLRDFFYNLPCKIEADVDKKAIEWLRTTAWNNPSLAYMAARVLQARGYSEVHWKFYGYLHLLYVALSSARCLDQDLLQEKAPQIMFKKHMQTWKMLDLSPATKSSIVAEIKRWRETVSLWSVFQFQSKIFFYDQTYNLGLGSSIVYLPWTDIYESKFIQATDEKTIACIECICNKVYDDWIHELESKK